MKFFVSILLTALLSFALGLFLPWWSIAIAAFFVGVGVPQKAGWAFLAGFLALFILWSGMAMLLSSGNGDILAGKMAMLILKKNDPIVLILATGLVGAVVGGFAAVAGAYARKMVKG